MTPNEVFKAIEKQNIDTILLKFDDLNGFTQKLNINSANTNENLFYDGHPFDYSQIDIWNKLNTSELLLIPDPKTAKISLSNKNNCINIICDVCDIRTGELYNLSPRTIARKAIDYMHNSSIKQFAFSIENFNLDSDVKIINILKYFWNPKQNFFNENSSREESKIYTHALAGISKHQQAINILCQSHPSKAAFSQKNLHTNEDLSYKLEFFSANSPAFTYLGFSAIIMAMIDGIKNEITEDEPYEAINTLKNNSNWLQLGDVFSDDLIKIYS